MSCGGIILKNQQRDITLKIPETDTDKNLLKWYDTLNKH